MKQLVRYSGGLLVLLVLIVLAFWSLRLATYHLFSLKPDPFVYPSGHGPVRAYSHSYPNTDPNHHRYAHPYPNGYRHRYCRHAHSHTNNGFPSECFGAI